MPQRLRPGNNPGVLAAHSRITSKRRVTMLKQVRAELGAHVGDSLKAQPDSTAA